MADFAMPAPPSHVCPHAAERPCPTKADPQAPFETIREGAFLYLAELDPELVEAGLKRPSAPL
eukprot:COSAG01_NODE_1228_length_11129_cov_184.387851_3_plen_63_part_00